jgi:hypothetical protein
MKKTSLLEASASLFTILLFAGLQVSAFAAPKPPKNIRYRFSGASALASHSESNDCGFKMFNVGIYENFAKDADPLLGEKKVEVGYRSVDYCNGIYSEGYGETSLANITLGNGKPPKSATVNANVPLTILNGDETSQTGLAKLNLSWLGEGDIDRTTFYSEREYDLGLERIISRSRSRGTSQFARVTGSVMINGLEFLAPGSSVNGYTSLSQSDGGTLTKTILSKP